MAGELHTLAERLDLMEFKLQELLGAQEKVRGDAATEFWKLLSLEARLDLLDANEAPLVDEESMDGIDPMVRFFGETDSGAFSGTAYVNGAKTTGLTSNTAYPWVKVVFSTGAATEVAGPPSDPFPDDEEWFEKTKTFGDIHASRA